LCPVGGEALVVKKLTGSRTYQSVDRATFSVMIGVPFFILVALTVGPLLYSAFYLSLTNWNLSMTSSRKFIGLGNYIQMMRNPEFWTAVFNSFYQVFGTLVLQLVLGMTTALLLARPMKGIRVLRSAYLIPMMSTPVVVGLTWRMLYMPELGLFNYLLSLLRIPGPDWLGSAKIAMLSVILTDVWLTTPFVTMILLSGIMSLPTEPHEAAKVDGASGLQAFWHVTLPLLRPFISLAVMFRIMDGFKRFDTIYVMTSGGPGTATQTLNLLTYYHGFEFLNTGYAASLSTMMLLIMAGLTIYLLVRIQRSEGL
jgi:multiple sugar transport system permease protein